MRLSHSNVRSVFSSSQVFTKSKRGIPFLPGLLLILTGLVVLVAPRLVLGAIAAVLLMLGFLFCYVAYKFMMLRKQMSAFAKSVEGSLYSGGFKSTKPDIDVTDLDSDKIVYH
jgi:hypothetical protein